MERRIKRSRAILGMGLLLLGTLGASSAWSAATLYSQPSYESPVRADPDDLLLLPGQGLSASDSIVYAAVTNTTLVPRHPVLGVTNTARAGLLDLVSAADAPYALTAHLPTAMTFNQSYAIWVHSFDGSWSNPVFINDARPLWITPDSTYQTTTLANLPRVLKVVGRNLQPGQNATATQVRLLGQNTGASYTLTANSANNDPNTTASLQRYVAAVQLPASMVVDQYTVQVSRDAGLSWVSLLGNGQSPAQTFTVNADPADPNIYPVTGYADPSTGKYCAPNSTDDATGCIMAAIRAAAQGGGGTVVFSPGTWVMSNPGTWPPNNSYSNRLATTPFPCAPHPSETCGVSYFGVLVPPGVNLWGSSASSTIIQRGTGWVSNSNPVILFTLMGNNSVTGIDFADQITYTASSPAVPMLQLGVKWYFAHLYGNTDPLNVTNVVISQNVFDKPGGAIGNGGLPMDHIYITSNTFGGANQTAIALGQDPNEVANLSGGGEQLPYQTYHFNDSVIDYNTFYPSSLNNVPANGTMATGLNTALRVDISNNSADGRVNQTQYLYNPTDPTGWRAGHFFTPGANTEMLLFSNNYIGCPGDKSNDDGEAVAFDGQGTLGGLPTAEPVVAAVPWTDPNSGVAGTSITLQGTLVTQVGGDFQGNPMDLSQNPTPYYKGFWAQVVGGAGKGQWRKVVSVALGNNGAGSTVTLNVTPAFDVAPDATSVVTLAQAYWQALLINNYVEQRKTQTPGTPLCTKANSLQKGGKIVLYSSTADSVIEGNQQFDTDGIEVAHGWQSAIPLSTQYPAGLNIQSTIEVRNNVVQGEYNWPNSTPNSSNGVNGIQLIYGAAIQACNGGSCTNNAPPPPVTGFATSIAGNSVSQTQTLDAHAWYAPLGAIGMGTWGWYGGQADGSGQDQWELGADTLVFNNNLQNISGASAPQIGIGVANFVSGTTGHPAPTEWRAVLYGNACQGVDKPLVDLGTSTVRYCPVAGATSCECSGAAPVDVGIAATTSSNTINVGGSVTYTVTVTNNSSASAASNVVVAVTPAAGAQLTSLAPSQSCDASPSVNLCNLGPLNPGQAQTVTVVATFASSGTYPLTFSVTHHEPDAVVANDSTTVNVTAQ